MKQHNFRHELAIFEELFLKEHTAFPPMIESIELILIYMIAMKTLSMNE
jgi:hypothetical protein